MTWLDTVVPTLAPRMTPSDCTNERSPASTSAITMMIVTDDESRAAVATVPVATPAKRFAVARASTRRMRSPATARIPAARRDTP
jgi:hypothetical protein